MLSDKQIQKALEKKALGFTADEVVEDYVLNDEGNLVLTKRRVTTKYYPPDTQAIKSVSEMDNGLENLSEEELLQHKLRLIRSLADKP